MSEKKRFDSAAAEGENRTVRTNQIASPEASSASKEASDGRSFPDAPVVAHVYRGSIVESLHRAHIAVVNTEGEVLASAGDPSWVTYWRSSAKPAQALPLITSGAADAFGLTDEEIAVVCASHAGQPYHVETVKGILRKIDVGEEALRCGAHPPHHRPSAEALQARGEKPRAVHNNCSGKHAGMLALARHLGADIDTYLQPDHPVCTEIKRSIGYLTDLHPDQLVIGVDGCGVPVYGMPIAKMAQAYARLAMPESLESKADPSLIDAAQRVTRSMTRHPHLVSGDQRLTTDLMRIAQGRIVAKDGAEAVYCVGIIGQGIGIAAKIEDGSSRSLGPIILDALHHLGLLIPDQLGHLQTYHRPIVKNVAGRIVGEIRPALPTQLIEKLREIAISES